MHRFLIVINLLKQFHVPIQMWEWKEPDRPPQGCACQLFVWWWRDTEQGLWSQAGSQWSKYPETGSTFCAKENPFFALIRGILGYCWGTFFAAEGCIHLWDHIWAELEVARGKAWVQLSSCFKMACMPYMLGACCSPLPVTHLSIKLSIIVWGLRLILLGKPCSIHWSCYLQLAYKFIWHEGRSSEEKVLRYIVARIWQAYFLKLFFLSSSRLFWPCLVFLVVHTGLQIW